MTDGLAADLVLIKSATQMLTADNLLLGRMSIALQQNALPKRHLAYIWPVLNLCVKCLK